MCRNLSCTENSKFTRRTSEYNPNHVLFSIAHTVICIRYGVNGDDGENRVKCFIVIFVKGGSVRSTRVLGPTMTARGQSIGISIGMLPQTLILSIMVQKTSKYYTTEFDLEEGF